MSLHAVWLRLHRWLALAAALPLVLLGLSGALLTFENEIDRALNPQLWNVPARGQPRSLEDLSAAVRRSFPHDRITGLRLPGRDDRAVETSLASGLLVYVDPYDGRVLGSRRQQVVAARIHQFHTNLLLGQSGSLVMGVSALALVVLAGSGLTLWWRSKIARFSLSSPWRRLYYDVHSAMGLYGLLFWLVLGITGAMMTFEDFAQPAIDWLTRSAPLEIPRLATTVPPGAQRMALDRLVEAAEQTLPGATVTLVSLPLKPEALCAVFLRFPEDRTPAGRSRVFVDPYNARALWKVSTRDVPLGTWLWFQHRSAHTGDWFGWPTRLLTCAASLLAVLQLYTGLRLWWGKQ